MSAVKKRQIRLLAPYLEGEGPSRTNIQGEREWDMHCPLHEDNKRSASLNVDSGVWYCQAGCGGGRVAELIRIMDQWVPPGASSTNGGPRRSAGRPPEELPTEASVSGWHSNLMSNDAALENLINLRGLTTDTIVEHRLGYQSEKRLYTLPIWDAEGALVNVRRYNPYPKPDRRKIWGVTGHNTPRLYPIKVLQADPEFVIICEGEFDALVTNQNGYPAITRTGAADVWQASWGEWFKDRIVYLCHDMDDKGAAANRKIGRLLRRIASDIKVIKLPYEPTPKDGKDLSDFWAEHDRQTFEHLLAEAQSFRRKGEREPETVTVLDSFDAQRVGKPVKLVVTIKGKKDPGYTVPRSARLTCTRDAGTKCQVCPLNGAGGDATLDIAPDNPVILEMLDSTKAQLHDIIRREYGAVKCNRLTIEAEDQQAVEILLARPSVDHVEGGADAGRYKNIKITNVGRHDTLSNNTVAVTGALHANPRSQVNEFQSWRIEHMETSVDRFDVTEETVRLLKRFQAKGKPLKKLGVINRSLAEQVTKIHGRPEMHALMDLTFHSVLSFKFGGEVIDRGWLESLVVGDTRTGKSLAASRLAAHFGAGEVISCEAASFAGVVGGLQQMGGRDWAVTWGVVPINDRRLVVLDEISGLTQEEISQMSDVRSSGLAKLTKIQQEVTFARTRLLWLGNPRGGGMMDYTYGVDAIRPLIGNPEDIARFDLAMAVVGTDVPADEINLLREESALAYSSEACHALLMWVWTRQPDQIIWAPGSEEAVMAAANEVGSRYVEDPPLIQAASVRVKIARVAAALAARLFSTDETNERVIVKPEHVEAAVQFMDRLYKMIAFGYADRSRERIADIAQARENEGNIKQYLWGNKSLAKFLRSSSRFRRQDLEEILNIQRDEANGIINKLWESRMVRKDGQDVRVEPVLHSLLREATWQ